MDVGRFVRTDDITVDKTRLDFACILISTPQIEILNMSSDFITDGSLYSIKMVEEWGCNLGEDAFLTETDTESRTEPLPHCNNGNGMEEVQGEWELDDLVNNLHKEWSLHEGKRDGKENELEEKEAISVSKVEEPKSVKQQEYGGFTLLEPVVTNDKSEVHNMKKKEQQQYIADRQQHSGPWSLEWLPSFND